MSATINANDLKFVIFGAGHDYTLADSGEGEKIFFCHRKVPLNSYVRAGQFYFLAPVYDDNDEDVPPVITDVVRYDQAHCTFTPDLNEVFDTVGEVEVSVHYRREYVYAESTILVEKELTQTIEVVDHGSITESQTYGDLYSDGYCFIRPNGQNIDDAWISLNMYPSKLSNIPWRVAKLGYGIYSFIGANYITDISELADADTSNVNEISKLFSTAFNLSNISALENWDVSKVTSMSELFSYSVINDLSPLEKWNTKSLVSLQGAFEQMPYVKSLHGLENWDVSNVTNMYNAFASDTVLEDISALENWDTSKVTDIGSIFNYGLKIKNLHGLENWDVSNVTNFADAFSRCESITTLLELADWNTESATSLYNTFAYCYGLTNLEGLENWDVSNVTTLNSAFYQNTRITTIEALRNWDTSKVQYFNSAFMNCHWVESVEPLKDWSFASAASVQSMFYWVNDLSDVDNIEWDLTALSGLSGMFNACNMYYSSELSRKVWETSFYFYDYEGNQYSNLALSDLTLLPKDASNASNWDVNGSGLGAFNSVWSNIPSWN